MEVEVRIACGSQSDQSQALHIYVGLSDGSGSKESACNAGHSGSIPGSGRSAGEGNGNPLQCSCLDNSVDRGA